MSEVDNTARPSSLWQHGDFMRLWTGQTISQLGSQITVIAFPLTAILLFNATPFQVGLLGTLEFLPFVLFGLPVGVWVDRLRRKPILVVADLARFALIATVPLAYAFGALRIGHLYAVAFVAGVFTVFFDVAYGSYLPSLIDRARLMEGNSKLEISRSGAQLVGPGVGGILVQVFRAPVALLADAVSYLGSVIFLLLIRRKEPPVEPPPGEPQRMTIQIREGLRYVLRHRLLRPLLICTATLNLASGLNLAVLLLFAVRSLGLKPGVIGAAMALGNIGFVGGAIVSRRATLRLGVGPTIIGAGVVIGLGWSLIPLAGSSTGVALLFLSGFLGSFGAVIYNVNARSLAQSITPERMLGRTIATLRFAVWGTIPLGTFFGGLLGGRIGLRPTLWLSAVCGLVAFLPPLLSDVGRLTEMPALAEETIPPVEA
jgi:MFS family permease